MFDALKQLILILNSLTPLGIIGGLCYIIYVQLKSKTKAAVTDRKVDLLGSNHLSGLPDMQEALNSLVASSQRQEGTLKDILAGINYLKGRLNGHSND